MTSRQSLLWPATNLNGGGEGGSGPPSEGVPDRAYTEELQVDNIHRSPIVEHLSNGLDHNRLEAQETKSACAVKYITLGF